MAPLNHLAELLARVAIIAGNILFRKAVQAYRSGAAQHLFKQSGQLQLRRRMSVEEAQQILGLSSSTLLRQEILKRAERLHEINQATDRFPGSPYIQRKATTARYILEEHLRTTQKKQSGTTDNA